MTGDRDRLDQVLRYAEGMLDVGEVKELEVALREDANLRRDFMEYLNVDATLAEYAALPESEVAGTYAARGVGRRFPRGLSFAVAATVLLAAAAAVWVGRFASESLRKKEIVEVEVLSAEQAELEGHERAVHNGERMQLSRLALKRGSLRLRLPSGVVLDLLGPVDGVFDGPARFHLARGGLNADVGERGKGFAVVTKAGEILDLGTRFGVNVSQAGEADIAVFSGEVRVHDCGIRSSNAFVTVSEGEALRLHVGRHADRQFPRGKSRSRRPGSSTGRRQHRDRGRDGAVYRQDPRNPPRHRHTV